ncbi:MAG TPA: hypothetical protein VGO58_14135 [Chitinophagaceae bacterium]|jgi:hypothetical protein|nr:hypothetical protein [Chitinophagaceae bacterium]
MRKVLVIICSLVILFSCNSSGEKSTPKITKKEKVVQSPADMELQGSLKGKVWTAENDMAPMALLKLKTDGTYELRSGKYADTWEIRDGKIVLARLTEWPIEKLNDTTFRLYVKPTDKWYTYKYTSSID